MASRYVDYTIVEGVDKRMSNPMEGALKGFISASKLDVIGRSPFTSAPTQTDSSRKPTAQYHLICMIRKVGLTTRQR